MGQVRRRNFHIFFTKSQFKFLRPRGAPSNFHAGVVVKEIPCRQDTKMGLLSILYTLLYFTLYFILNTRNCYSNGNNNLQMTCSHTWDSNNIQISLRMGTVFCICVISGHVARMGEERGVYRFLVGKPE